MQPGVTVIRPGQRLIMPGVRVMQTRATGGGWWNNYGAISGCVAAYAPKGAADLASSYTNLANPGTNNAAPGVAPTWDATNGWTFNGSTQYLTTGITPALGWSMIVRFSGVSGTSGCAAGLSSGGSGRFFIFPVNSSTNRLYGYSGSLSVAGAQSTAVMAIAATNCYLNAASDGNTVGSSIAALQIYIGARNNSSVADTFLNGKVQAIAIYNSTLSSGDVSTLTTLMNAL